MSMISRDLLLYELILSMTLWQAMLTFAVAAALPAGADRMA